MAHLSQLHAFTLAEQSHSYRFTPVELARLVVYKAAVTPGFYTNQIEDGDRER